jgi:hypothetical protein
MSPKLPILAVTVASALTASPRIAAEESEWLEPEEGVFAGYDGPNPFELALRQVLLEGDHYRACQLVSMPSFASERAVFIRDEGPGPVTVVSRVLKQQPSPAPTPGEKTTDAAKGPVKSITFADFYKRLALDTIRATVETKTASLDRQSADEVMKACREVLLRTCYSPEPRRGNDGVIYHAGHWVSGTFLAGQTWSPKAGTISCGVRRPGGCLEDLR